MTIDERLEFLTQSTESLHATCQELHASVAEMRAAMTESRAALEAQARRDRNLRTAMLEGMRTFLERLDENGTGEEGKA